MVIPSSDNALKGKGVDPMLFKSSPPDEHMNLPQQCPHGIMQFLKVTMQWEMVNEWPDTTNLK